MGKTGVGNLGSWRPTLAKPELQDSHPFRYARDLCLHSDQTTGYLDMMVNLSIFRGLGQHMSQMSRLAVPEAVPGARVSRRALGLLGNIETRGTDHQQRIASIAVRHRQTLPNPLCAREVSARRPESGPKFVVKAYLKSIIRIIRPTTLLRAF